LSSTDKLPVHPEDIAWTIGLIYGLDTLLEVINSLQPGTRRSWAYLALALMSDDQNEAKNYAEIALIDGLPLEGWRECLRTGADPNKFSGSSLNLPDLTARVISTDIQYHEEILSQWLTAI